MVPKAGIIKSRNIRSINRLITLAGKLLEKMIQKCILGDLKEKASLLISSTDIVEASSQFASATQKTCYAKKTIPKTRTLTAATFQNIAAVFDWVS